VGCAPGCCSPGATGAAARTLGYSTGLTALGVACFGGGAGLHTLARPWAIQSIYGIADAGRVNGVMARYEGFARAGGPVAVALLYEQGGAVSVFGGLSAALLVMAPILWRFMAGRREASTNAA
jgi:hypothetical protein